jgi:anthranilate synthase/aminodeoxychorismate synthase-like glutamine amidotransferase
MLLILDNYDSFTYNLVQYFGELGVEMKIFRNDALTVDDVKKLAPEKICISPGPCTPNEAGISLELIREFGPSTPILGVCLGHQSIGQVYGGDVVRADRLMHGKTSPIHHNSSSVFAGLPNPFEATRYHSLIVKRETLPDCLEITAWTAENEIMGLCHKEYPVHGVQFHPESILTENGKQILETFLKF